MLRDKRVGSRSKQRSVQEYWAFSPSRIHRDTLQPRSELDSLRSTCVRVQESAKLAGLLSHLMAGGNHSSLYQHGRSQVVLLGYLGKLGDYHGFCHSVAEYNAKLPSRRERGRKCDSQSYKTYLSPRGLKFGLSQQRLLVIVYIMCHRQVLWQRNLTATDGTRVSPCPVQASAGDQHARCR